MLSVNRIRGSENSYNKQNKLLSFQSKFVPNEALKDAFYVARINAEYGNATWQGVHSRSFAKIIDSLLNDGKDDLIKVTRSKHGSTLFINEHRVNFYSEDPPASGFVDGSRAIDNIVNYFISKTENPFVKLSKDEFKAIKPALDNLNAELNADDVTKNPEIILNLKKNMDNIDWVLIKHTVKFLEKLEAKIFNK